MKKIFTSLLAIVFCFLLTACGRGAGDPDRFVNLGKNYTPGFTIDTSKEYNMKIGISGTSLTQEETDLVNLYIDKFESQYPNVHFEIDKITTEYNRGLISRAQADKKIEGKMPEILWMTSDGMQQIIDETLILNLEPYIEKDPDFDTDDYVDAMWKLGQKGYDGDQYMIPRSSDQIVCHINKKAFRDVGMEDKIPTNNDWTWDEMMTLLGQLRVAYDAKGWQNKKIIDSNINWNPVYVPLMVSYGCDIVDEYGEVDVVNDGMKKALEEIIKFKNNNYSTFGAGSFTSGTGEALMFHSYSADYVRNSFKDAGLNPDTDYAVVACPTINGEQSVVGAGTPGWSIYNYTTQEKKDIAWQFLKMIISEEGQNMMKQAGISSVPIRKDMQDPEKSAWGADLYKKGVNVSAFNYKTERNYALNFLMNVDNSLAQNLMDELNGFVTNWWNGLLGNVNNAMGTLDGKLNVLLG